MIRPATPAELPAVGELVARSFDHLPQTRYLVPDARERLPIMTGFFTLEATAAALTGRVDLIEGPTGTPAAAAIWFNRTQPTDPIPLYARKLAAVVGHRLPAFETLDALLGSHHPATAHWHLAYLAVHPVHQHAGLGTALLQHAHTRLTTTAAYLEATNHHNARLYRRLGYHPLNPYEIRLPDGAPFYRLNRPPAAPD